MSDTELSLSVAGQDGSAAAAPVGDTAGRTIAPPPPASYDASVSAPPPSAPPATVASAPDAAAVGDGSGAAADAPPRDAIVLVAGLRPTDPVRSADEAARRIARAFEVNADPTAIFLVQESREQAVRDSAIATRCVTVLRRDRSGAERAVVDVYDLPYQSLIAGDDATRTPAGQALGVLGTLVGLFGRVVRYAFHPGKSRAEKWQVALGLACYAVLVGYVALLIVTAVATLAPHLPGVPPAVRRVTDGPLAGMQAAIVALTALGLFNRASFKQTVQRAGAITHAVTRYLAAGEGASDVRGAFAALLQHVLEQKVDGGCYARVHVIGYSFGSVLALDALFPCMQADAHLARVDSLTTIGCPFDLVRTYWPSYFAGRHAARGGAPATWLNVYAAADVLGSTFAASGKGAPPGIALTDRRVRAPDLLLRYGPAPEVGNRSLTEQLTLVGFRSHRTYWERAGSDSCFGLVVPALFQGRPALA